MFPPRRDYKTEFRVWNTQLLRYAGYRQNDGSVIGDPVSVELTEVILCKILRKKALLYQRYCNCKSRMVMRNSSYCIKKLCFFMLHISDVGLEINFLRFWSWTRTSAYGLGLDNVR